MRRKRLGIVSLISLVALVVLAVGISASTGSASTDKATKGHKIFFLPEADRRERLHRERQGRQGSRGEARRHASPTTGRRRRSAAKQVPFIDSAARQGYDAIIISANDPNAVAPALKRAQQRGLKVISYDGDVRKDARTIFVSPPTASAIGAFQVEWMGAQIGYKGEIAILSATPTAANQNTWIKFMKATLKLPKYRNMKLVKVAYGNDNPTDSAKETQALVQAYPNLKGIISPTTVGISSAAQVLDQAGQVQVGRADGPRPSEPDAQVRQEGVREEVRLWNERDFGYLATYVANLVLDGKLTGKIGQTFTAGRLGKRTVVRSDGNAPVVVLGDPLVFTPQNIDKFNF